MVILLSTTSPTLILNGNAKRKRLSIQMQSTNVDANNTGRIHIAFGSQPVATVGHGAQGEVLMQSDVIDEPRGSYILSEKYKRSVWATSSQNTQTLTVEEELEEGAAPTPPVA